ncbi:MAG: type II CRISPR-associated endonuclease Cas1, partial [Armatimonadetes bacterium]|nr:type II CRISPR-associated endonuclease Cas1 [Candidatus Hippobium faecium]
IILVNCDSKHLPIYMSLGTKANSRKVQVENMQLSATEPFRKRIWQSIVMQKITNQGNCLNILDIKGWSKILGYAKKVASGDGDNTEAVAANRYFSYLFGKDFSRRDGNIINIALNYGYSIVRSLTARSLAGSGFLLSKGVFHHNELNAYNLADDFMEPYRPLVDYIVYDYFRENEDYESLTGIPKELKNRLLGSVEYTVLIDGKRQSVRRSAEIMSGSFQTALSEKDYRILKLPEFDRPELYSYE